MPKKKELPLPTPVTRQLQRELDVVQEEKKTLLASAEEETIDYGKELTLSSTEQEDIIANIKTRISEVEGQRADMFLKTEWQEADDLYDSIVDPWDDDRVADSNMFIAVIQMVCDILLEKEKKRTFTTPTMTLKPDYSYKTDKIERIGRVQKWMDCRVKADIEPLDDWTMAYSDSNKYGCGTLKLTYEYSSEVQRVLEVYDIDKKELERFVGDFEHQKEDPIFNQLLSDFTYRLENGIMDSIECWVEKTVITKNAPTLRRVDIHNLYRDCIVNDLESQSILPEKIPDLTWKDINDYVDCGYLDKSVISRLKKKYKKKCDEMMFNAWESLYRYRIKDKYVLCVFTYVEEDEPVLGRARVFPYITNKPNYIIYQIKPRSDRSYGDGMPKLLKNTNLMLNTVWNQEIDSATMRNLPLTFAKKGSFDPGEKCIDAGIIYWMNQVPADNVRVFHPGGGGTEFINIVSRIERYMEWISGVSAYMSGRESPLDPNAPASKAYMLLQEANIRINAYITNLDKANKQLFAQMKLLYYQYFDKRISYFEPGQNPQFISRSDIALNFEFVPTLSDITINQALEREENLMAGKFLLAMPMVNQNPMAVRKIIEIILKSSGRDWEKYTDVLLPPEEEAKAVTLLRQLMQTMPPEQIMSILQGYMQQQMKNKAMAGGGAGIPGAEGAGGRIQEPAEALKGKVPGGVV